MENHCGEANHLSRLEKLQLISILCAMDPINDDKRKRCSELKTYSGANSKRVGKRELDTEGGPV